MAKASTSPKSKDTRPLSEESSIAQQMIKDYPWQDVIFEHNPRHN
jgi:hypothetical protein